METSDIGKCRYSPEQLVSSHFVKRHASRGPRDDAAFGEKELSSELIRFILVEAPLGRRPKMKH